MTFEKAYNKLDEVLTKTPVIGPHWQTTLSGWVAAGCVAGWAFVEDHDYHDPKFYVKLGAAVFLAIKAKVSADAKKVLVETANNGK